jgi:hypothetical protein
MFGKLLAGGTVFYIGAKLLQPWFNTWGASSEEQLAHAPGEDALPDAKITSTHAITIEAPAEAVWPWLVQMGVGRGGFYSYAWLENLVGCQVKNTDRIHPELQDLKQGDGVRLHPKAPPLRVTYLEKNRAIALEGWILYLNPIGTSRTRLITRTCAFSTPKGAPRATKIINFMCNSVLFDMAHFIMGRKQLLEIKRLVESGLNKSTHDPEFGGHTGTLSRPL